jgi:glucose-1-phosphate thymidylyltransferase
MPPGIALNIFITFITKNMTKGIILAGGKGTRLYPLTQPINKQLLPVYDVPMVYYPLATLMEAGIKDILIISSPEYIDYFKKLFCTGEHLGLNISYKTQDIPNGIAQSFILGEDFIGKDQVCLILGDNIFHGNIDFEFATGAKIYAYQVKNPSDYGVVEFNKEGKALRLVEKPKEFISNYAVPGLYFYDNDVIEIAKNLEPSARGEYEITDINKEYLKRGKLYVSKMKTGVAWLDAGSPSALRDASDYVHAIESRQGKKIACLEEIALIKGFITMDEFKHLLNNIPNSEYKNYLNQLI